MIDALVNFGLDIAKRILRREAKHELIVKPTKQIVSDVSSIWKESKDKTDN